MRKSPPYLFRGHTITLAIPDTAPTRQELAACFENAPVASIRALYSFVPQVYPQEQATFAALLAEAQRALRRHGTERTPGGPEAQDVATLGVSPISDFGVPHSTARCEIGQQRPTIDSSAGPSAARGANAEDWQASWGAREDVVCGRGRQGSGVVASVFSQAPAYFALSTSISRVESQFITFPQVRRHLSGHLPRPIKPESRAALGDWVRMHNRVATDGVRVKVGGRGLQLVYGCVVARVGVWSSFVAWWLAVVIQ